MTICAEAALKIRELELKLAATDEMNVILDRERNRLSDLCRLQQNEIARQAQVIDDYGQHAFWCISVIDKRHDKSCDCGFNTARQRTPDTATEKAE